MGLTQIIISAVSSGGESSPAIRLVSSSAAHLMTVSINRDGYFESPNGLCCVVACHAATEAEIKHLSSLSVPPKSHAIEILLQAF